jgi:alkaline phosphatase D
LSFTRIRTVAITATLAALALAQACEAKSFRYGVAAGEVEATSAKVWTRADKSGEVAVQLGRKRLKLERVKRVKARKSHDYTVTVELRHLKPGRTYYYAFRQGPRRSDIGRFRTAPKASSRETIRFGWSGDADAQPLTPGGPPFWNAFEVYGRMAAEHNTFNINLGDTIYSDSEVGTLNANGQFQLASLPAFTVAEKWAKYRLNLGQAPLRTLRSTASFYSHWDDHEFIDDFTQAQFGFLYQPGVAAFRDYAPVTYTPKNGLYRSFRWGRNLQLFFLDERSFRSAKASANHACDNPPGQPDPAPTLPANTRMAFSTLLPSTPVSQQCLATLNDPNRTMLGSRQYNRFTKAVRRSKATWKVVLNEVPIQQFYTGPYDRWEGYAAERTKLLQFLKHHVKNVLFLTTDIHANFINDARLQTLEPGGVVNSGILEVTTGPVATETYKAILDQATGKPGAGIAITQALFRPLPAKGGVGMSCAAPDVSSYGEVKVTRNRLRVELKQGDGKPVVDAATGQPCKPIVRFKQ